MDFSLAPLVTISLRSVVIYVFIVIAIRVFGKKELAQLSVIDLVFILLISNSVQNAMVGPDTSVLGGLAAAFGLFVVNYLFKILLFRFPSISKYLEGEAIMLIYKGKIKTDNLNKAQFTVAELEACVREHGVEHISDVDLAVLEADGNISVMSGNYNHKTVRRRKAHKVLTKTA